MNNTAKGLPATSIHTAGHKTTKNQRRATRSKQLSEWAKSNVGLGSRKRMVRKMVRAQMHELAVAAKAGIKTDAGE
jgi:hypothetical protein